MAMLPWGLMPYSAFPRRPRKSVPAECMSSYSIPSLFFFRPRRNVDWIQLYSRSLSKETLGSEQPHVKRNSRSFYDRMKLQVAYTACGSPLIIFRHI